MRERQRAVRSDIVTELEIPWMEAVDGAGITAVRDVLLEHGVPPSQAGNLAVWLDDQLNGRRVLSRGTATLYRRVLRGLPWPPANLRKSSGVAQILAA